MIAAITVAGTGDGLSNNLRLCKWVSEVVEVSDTSDEIFSLSPWYFQRLIL